MGKRARGKERKDRYYQLAKEQGFRARSAFKLIQLAQKFEVFKDVNTVLDLCAAPGGWLQVAKNSLPLSSVVIGVDLHPIKALRGVTTIQADITQPRCRHLVKKECKEFDLVLHDGAPNLGTSWSHDAYVQNELVLHSVKLAADFLRPGGKFVTKVFRSSDYNSLLWVLNQIFGKVTATKPESSRYVSAEIYLICFDFKGHAKIDPRFFDPRHVFVSVDHDAVEDAKSTPEEKAVDASIETLRSMLTASPKIQGGKLSEVLPKQRRNRGGYSEKDNFKAPSILEYFFSKTPVQSLVTNNKFSWSFDKETEGEHAEVVNLFKAETLDFIKNHSTTTAHELAAVDDLKVLGKGDLMRLLKWRYRIVTDKQFPKFAPVDSEAAVEETQGENPEVEGDADLTKEEKEQEELKAVISEHVKDEMRDKRRRRKELQKLRWMQKRSVNAFDPQNEDYGLFKLDRSTAASLDTAHQNLDYEKFLEDPEFGQPAGDAPFEDEEDVAVSSIIDPEVRRLLQLEKDLNVAHEAGLLGAKRNKEFGGEVLLARKMTRAEKSRAKWTQQWISEADSLEEQMLTEAARVRISKQRDQDDLDDDEEKDLQSADAGAGDADSSDEEGADSNDGGGPVSSDDTGYTSSEDEGGESDEDLGDDEAKEKSLGRAEAADAKAGKASATSDLSPAQQVQAKRWLQQPLFQNLGLSEVLSGTNNDFDVADEETAEAPPARGKKRRRHDAASDDENDAPIRELSDSELQQMPLTEKQKRKIKRQKADSRWQKKLRRRGANDEEEDTCTKSGKALPFKEVARETDEQLEAPKDFEEAAMIQAVGLLMTKKSARMDLMDGAYHRYMRSESRDALPKWLLEDEDEVYKVEPPVSAALLGLYRSRLKEIQERPMKKVAEALAKKKKKMQTKMNRVRLQAQAIAESATHDETTKAKAIEKITKKALRELKTRKNVIIANRKGAVGQIVSGAVAKGARKKLVDSRLKKDKRAKMAQKQKKKDNPIRPKIAKRQRNTKKGKK